MKEHLADGSISKGAEYSPVVTGIISLITSIISSLTLSDLAAIVGILVALSGWWYRRKESKLLEKKLMAELLEIQTRAKFMEKAANHPMQNDYFQPDPALKAMETPPDEQTA